MCGGNPNRTKKVGFRLIKLDPERAKKIGSNPGVMYLVTPETVPGSGRTQAEIIEIVHCQNKWLGYPGVNAKIA